MLALHQLSVDRFFYNSRNIKSMAAMSKVN